MTPEEYKAQVNEIVDAHIEKTRAFDTRKITTRLQRPPPWQFNRPPTPFARHKLLEDNSIDSYEIGLQVWVKVYNRRKTGHLGLKPEAYRFYKPDGRILLAFAVIDARCEIEEKCLCAVHSKVW